MSNNCVFTLWFKKMIVTFSSARLNGVKLADSLQQIFILKIIN